MPRPRNIIIKRTINIGDRQQLARIIRDLYGLSDDISHLGEESLPALILNIRAKIMTPMLMKLREYPPRRKGMKIRWKSERQRRYVMAMLRATGQTEGYERTYKLRRGWQYKVEAEGSGSMITLRIWNEAESENPFTGEKTRYQPFVTGNIGLGESARSIKRYQAPIQPFHQDRGWKPAAPIILAYLRTANEVVANIYQNKLTAMLEKRLR